MGSTRRTPPRGSAAEVVRRRVEGGGERLWRLRDFADLPAAGVAQALSRLCRAGVIERKSKGVYYRPRVTVFGRSRTNPSAVRALAEAEASVFPAGVAAANLLGFTTQGGARAEVATSASSLPRKLVGPGTVVHTRRPAAWSSLAPTDAALLDFLRRRGRDSELSPEATIRRTLQLLRSEGRFQRLVDVAATEPPRVVALLGALGEAMRVGRPTLERLRARLNPLSRFDFGVFAGLPTARSWQAKR